VSSPFRRAAPLVGIALLALGGCGWHGADLPARPPAALLPAGSPLLVSHLPDRDAWLRHYLSAGAPDSAADILEGRVPGDGLLLDLHRGLVLRQAGRYRESNQTLERAEALAEARITRSLARAAGSFLVSDRVLDYEPAPTERLMIPFYRMLNHLDLGDVEAAVVEARRGAALADRLTDEGGICRQDAVVTLVGAHVFDLGGEKEDAEVARRRAARIDAECGAGSLAELAAGEGGDGDADGGGEILVLVEEGFVAHRVSRSIQVPLWPEEVEALRTEGAAGVAGVSALVAARMLGVMVERGTHGWALDDLPRVQWQNLSEGAQLVRVSWPASALAASRPAGVTFAVGDAGSRQLAGTDLSARAVADLEGDRAAIAARAVARAVARTFLVREVERRVEKEHGRSAARFAGLLTNVTANALDEPDTRTWTLLPDRLSLVRLSVPAGRHDVTGQVAGTGDALRTVDLGTVEVSAGERQLLVARLWGSETGDEAPLLRARQMAWERLATD
jgi:uncharacterized protein